MQTPKKTLKYQDVETKLRRLIATLPAGSKLQSERILAQTFECNFLTVRRALLPLVEEGTIVRRVGSGTFVAAHSTDTASRPARTRIGVLVFRSDDAYLYPVLQSISQAASEHNVELSSTWAADFSVDGLSRAKTLIAEGCTALILPWLPPDQLGEIHQFVNACSVPVSLPVLIPGLEKLCFERQDIFGSHAIAATEAIVRYFHRRGHQRIAFLGPDMPNDPILQKKLSSYACNISREKLPSLCALVSRNRLEMDRLAEEWGKFRDNLAVVAYDDEHALRFMMAMHKLGRTAPADYQIVGFNNIDSSRYSDPPLSTVCQNFGYIGCSLIKSALSLAAGNTWQSVEIPRTRLVVRATCGGAAAIDDAFRAAIPALDFVLEPMPLVEA